MADTKLTDLSAITSVADASLHYVVEGGASKKISHANLVADILADLTAGDVPDLSATYAAVNHNHTGTYQPLDSDLTAIAALTTTSFGRGLLTETDAASIRSTLGLVIGTNVQAYDADLTTWAGVTPGTGVATALGVSVGSAGAFVVNGGALGTPSSGTLTNATGLPTTGIVGWPANSSGVLTNNGSGTLSWATISSVSAADPTGTIGLTAVNGSASTFLRSDGAPALSQAIAPTWTGLHTFTPTVTTGNGLAVTGTPTSGNLVSIAASGTGAASNTKTGLSVTISGANATSGQTTYGARIANTSTGTSSTNIALDLSASGGTTNTALKVSAGESLFAGNLLITDATKFVQFGGATSSFPAIGKLGATNAFGSFAADGSAFVPFGADRFAALTHIQVGSTGQFQFFSLANNPLQSGGVADTGLARAAAGVARITNGSTGAGQLLIGTSSDTAAAQLHTVSGSASRVGLRVDSLANSTVDLAQFNLNADDTSTVANSITFACNSNGTAAAGFGQCFTYTLESSTTNDQTALKHSILWATATHASRAARSVWEIYDTAARECLRMEASGTAPMIGFLGASAVVRQTVSAAASDAATTQTLANDIRTALINLGLCV